MRSSAHRAPVCLSVLAMVCSLFQGWVELLGRPQPAQCVFAILLHRLAVDQVLVVSGPEKDRFYPAAGSVGCWWAA